MDIEYNYDLFVIGGGSGGLACGKEAAKYGAKVAIADFVKPTPMGTKWGLGGTCVNVGCIPKKLMHYASLMGEKRHDLKECGWEANLTSAHNWSKMLQVTSKHIKGLNFKYKIALIEQKVKYYNRLAYLESPHEIKLVDADGKSEVVTARNIVIAVGGRPSYPDLPNVKELAITSDDIFWMKESPGPKVLCVGAGYISLECGGFLNGLGNNVTILVRSKPLRTFDSDMADVIVSQMKKRGIRFLYGNITKLEKSENGLLSTTLTLNEGGEVVEEFNNVLMAAGRGADTQILGVEKVGIKTASNGKIITDENDATNVPHIYALGDVVVNLPELTPVAIKQGIFLARRLFGGGTTKLDRKMIPTTVFTPMEYGCVGLSQEEAVSKYGEENVSVYHSLFKPLEWAYSITEENEEEEEKYNAYTKVICLKTENEKVIGLHYAGPEAGEVIMGFSLAVKKGITKVDLEEQIGIHPTSAEEFVYTDTPYDESALKTGC